jgi:hypothetical protein
VRRRDRTSWAALVVLALLLPKAASPPRSGSRRRTTTRARRRPVPGPPGSACAWRRRRTRRPARSTSRSRPSAPRGRDWWERSARRRSARSRPPTSCWSPVAGLLYTARVHVDSAAVHASPAEIEGARAAFIEATVGLEHSACADCAAATTTPVAASAFGPAMRTDETIAIPIVLLNPQRAEVTFSGVVTAIAVQPVTRTVEEFRPAYAEVLTRGHATGARPGTSVSGRCRRWPGSARPPCAPARRRRWPWPAR